MAEPERVLARERRPIRRSTSRGPGSSGPAGPPRHPATPPPRPRGTACRTPPPAGSPPARRRSAVRAGRPAGPGSSAAPAGRPAVGRHPPVAVASQQTVVDQHREHLLDEQRRALGRGEDPIARLVRGVARPSMFPIRSPHIVGEWLEGDRRGVPAHLLARPAAPAARCRAPGSGLARPAGDVPDQVQERGSPQWMSSNTTASGAVCATASRNDRTAQNVSSTEPPWSAAPKS